MNVNKSVTKTLAFYLDSLSVRLCLSKPDEMNHHNEELSEVDHSTQSDKKGCWKVLFACLIGNVVVGGLLARKRKLFINRPEDMKIHMK